MSENELLFSLQCLQRRTARKRFRRDILDSWDGCAYCGRENPSTLDHVVPKAKGGKTTRNNLVASCADCNLSKSDTDFMEFYRGQIFWTEERELKILKWLATDPNASETAVAYKKACAEPLQLPAGDEGQITS
jgi:hypothetical protein